MRRTKRRSTVSKGQVEQGAPDLRIIRLVFLQDSTETILQHRRQAQGGRRRGILDRGNGPPTPIPSTARRNEPRLAAFAFFQVRFDRNVCLELTFDALRHTVCGLCRIDRHIEIEFDKLDVCHPRKRDALFLEHAILKRTIR